MNFKVDIFWAGHKVEISTLLLSYVVPVKSKVEILQNFVTFSQYMNFKRRQDYHLGYLINHNWERGGGGHQNLMGGGVTTWDKSMYPISGSVRGSVG